VQCLYVDGLRVAPDVISTEDVAENCIRMVSYKIFCPLNILKPSGNFTYHQV
jgi:hypothetical protein